MASIMAPQPSQPAEESISCATRRRISQHAVRPFLLTVLIFSLGLAGYTLWPFVNPIILGIVLASLAYPAYTWLSVRLRGHESLAALLVVIGIVLVIVLPILAVLSMLTVQGADTVNNISVWAKSVNTDRILEAPWIARSMAWLDAKAPFLHVDTNNLREQVISLSQSLGQLLIGWGTSLVGNIANLIVNFVIMMFVCYYMVRDGREMITSVKELSPLRDDQEERILSRIRGVTRSVLIGTFLTSISQGVLAAIGMWIVGLPPIFGGTMVTLASTIPVVGTALVWIPCAIYLFLTGEPKMALLWAAWASLLVGSVDNFLRPVFMQGSANMSTFYIFLSLIGGLRVFGLLGLLYGPLIMALATVMIYIYRHEYWDILSQAHQPVPVGEGGIPPGADIHPSEVAAMEAGAAAYRAAAEAETAADEAETAADEAANAAAFVQARKPGG